MKLDHNPSAMAEVSIAWSEGHWGWIRRIDRNANVSKPQVGPFKTPGYRSNPGLTETIDKILSGKLETGIAMERPAWTRSMAMCFTTSSCKVVTVLSCCWSSPRGEPVLPVVLAA